MGKALSAVAGGFRDVLGGPLAGLALVCLVIALGATIAAAWAALRYLVPMIPQGEGWWAYLSTAGEWLGGAAVVVIAIILAPAVSMIAGGGLFDVAAGKVERAIGVTPGRDPNPLQGFLNGLRIGLPALVLNIVAIPLYFVPIVNAFVFFGLNGYLMGREYAMIAALRRMSWEEAHALRKRAPVSVFLVGLVCSFIPFVAPLIGASAMTRLVKLLDPARA